MPVEVFLVEGGPGDVRLTQGAFREAKVAIRLHVATDGVDAVSFLRHEGLHADSPRPDLILLDLNLPKMDGREVLALIKDNTNLKMIPVVVLTTSASEEDILKTYRLHANCYVTKPVDLNEFLKVVRSIDEFWLTMVRLPRQAAK